MDGVLQMISHVVPMKKDISVVTLFPPATAQAHFMNKSLLIYLMNQFRDWPNCFLNLPFKNSISHEALMLMSII